MSASLATTLLDLPDEILDEICTLVPPWYLKNLRLTCRRMGSLAAPKLFKHVHVVINHEDGQHKLGFADIARDDALRTLVRGVTFTIEQKWRSTLPDIRSWYNLAHNIGRFTKLRSLNIRYNGSSYSQSQLAIYLWAVRTLFQSVAQSLHPRGPIRIEKLMIAHPELLTLQSAMLHEVSLRQILRSDSLTNLKIDFQGECDQYHRDSLPLHDLTGLESFVSTLLAPSVVSKLTDLSLINGNDYWGASKRIDIIELGGKEEMPNLRRLALGKFVFTRQAEIDWIASLPIEELYLNQCAILHAVAKVVPAEDETITATEEETPVEDDEYMCKWCAWTVAGNTRDIIRWQPLRWFRVYDQWKETMPELKVLMIGRYSPSRILRSAAEISFDDREHFHESDLRQNSPSDYDQPRDYGAESPFGAPIYRTGDDDFFYMSFGFNRTTWRTIMEGDASLARESFVERDRKAFEALQLELKKH